jgi:hypothetical protein
MIPDVPLPLPIITNIFLSQSCVSICKLSVCPFIRLPVSITVNMCIFLLLLSRLTREFVCIFVSLMWTLMDGLGFPLQRKNGAVV